MTDVYVPSEGRTPSKVMVIGEAPGAQEVAQRRPFIGPAGDLLRESLLSAGISKDDVYFTNLCKYRPPRNDLESYLGPDGSPAHEHLLSGILELIQEIRTVQPNVIVPVGSIPLAFTTELAKWKKQDGTYVGITEARGAVEEGRKLAAGRKVIPTFHPSFCLRGPGGDAVIMQMDLNKVKLHMNDPVVRYPDVERIYCEPGTHEAELVRRRLLLDKKPLVFDIEYSRKTKKLYCCGVTNSSSWAATIIIRKPSHIQWLKELLECGLPLVAQNAIFDVGILEWNYGFRLMHRLWYDTMIANHAAYIEMPKDLGFLCRQYTDYKNYWSQFDGRFWAAVERGSRSPDEMLEYNNDDAWVTAAVMEQQIEQEMAGTDPWDEKADDALPREVRATRLTFRHEMRLVPKLWEMSVRGVRINVEHVEKLSTTLMEEELALYEELVAMNHGQAINVKSGPQVAKFLYQTLKLRKLPGAKTKTGQDKVDDITLAKLELTAKTDEQRRGIRIIRDIRKKRDTRSKFCEIELDDDGRMRTIYDPAKTDTGRLSSKTFFPTGKGSNMQNPSREKVVRKAFVPDPGYEMGYADLERAESLVVAHITHDPMMVLKHQPGQDAHRITASNIYDKPIDEITDDERYMGKQAGHAGNYMMGWKRFMDLVNKRAKETGVAIDAAQAKRIIEKYRAMHVGLTRWWNQTAAELSRTQTLYNLLGRKRVFFDRVANILPNAVAFKPQSTVGDALNIALLKVADDPVLREWDFQLLMQVHDAIVYQYPIGMGDFVNARVRQLMAVPLVDPNDLTEFVIPVEIKVGKNWGEMEVWKADQAQQEEAA